MLIYDCHLDVWSLRGLCIGAVFLGLVQGWQALIWLQRWMDAKGLLSVMVQM